MNRINNNNIIMNPFFTSCLFQAKHDRKLRIQMTCEQGRKLAFIRLSIKLPVVLDYVQHICINRRTMQRRNMDKMD